MMREQLTGLARAEEWKSWMLKRRAAEAATADSDSGYGGGGGVQKHCAINGTNAQQRKTRKKCEALEHQNLKGLETQAPPAVSVSIVINCYY
jgi:hypothetical protein